MLCFGSSLYLPRAIRKDFSAFGTAYKAVPHHEPGPQGNERLKTYNVWLLHHELLDISRSGVAMFVIED